MSKKIQERKKITMTEGSLSSDARDAVYTLSGYFTVKHLIKAGELLKAECGEDAEICLGVSDWGDIDARVIWYRDETDEEAERRLIKEANISKRAREVAKTRKKNKEKKEIAVLERLMKKYPNKA